MNNCLRLSSFRKSLNMSCLVWAQHSPQTIAMCDLFCEIFCCCFVVVVVAFSFCCCVVVLSLSLLLLCFCCYTWRQDNILGILTGLRNQKARNHGSIADSGNRFSLFSKGPDCDPRSIFLFSELQKHFSWQ